VTRFESDAPVTRARRADARRQPAETSLHDVLALRFPVIHRMLGEPPFRKVARRFILSEPAGVPIPSCYGENFLHFLRRQGNGASIEYVADIAELEMLWGRAQYAPDVRPLPARALSSLTPQPPDGLQIALHPSVFLVHSRFPIVTIWENNRDNAGSSDGMPRPPW
jgi:Putative DNA-binding domain